MVAHMKTTIEIPDPLFEAAKKAAVRDGTTLKALVELWGCARSWQRAGAMRRFGCEKRVFVARGFSRQRKICLGSKSGSWGTPNAVDDRRRYPHPRLRPPRGLRIAQRGERSGRRTYRRPSPLGDTLALHPYDHEPHGALRGMTGRPCSVITRAAASRNAPTIPGCESRVQSWRPA